MKRFFAFAAGVVAAVSLSASVANAAPTANSAVPITGQGNLYKEVKKPVNISFTANITPGAGDTTLLPLMESNFTLPKDLAFVPDPNMPVCTAVNAGNSNFSGATAISLCPDSIVGDGTANIMLAGQVAALITDPEITIFNGGTDSSGGGILAIHAYSASTNAGIFMTGAIKNGNLDVKIPRLTADSATSTFTLSIPGTEGQDKGYAEATCSTGKYTSSAVITLGNRDSGGTVTNETSLSTDPVTTDCVGLAGKAKLSAKAKGPAKVKSGKKGTFKVTLKNTGTASAKNVKVTASGAGKGSASGGTIKPGTSKTVKVKAKVSGKKGKKVTVKFKATATGGVVANAKAKVKVG